MALIPYSQQDEFDLVHDGQDVRGWPVRDAAGNSLGKVAEMMVDPERELITSLILEDGREIPASGFELRDHTVTLGGANVRPGETATNVQTTNAARGGRELAEGEMSLPVVEEQLRVGKRTVERGGVRVSSQVTEQPVEETVRLREEHVNVERRPVDRPIANADLAALGEREIEVSTMAEEAVVSKQARVVEEVVVSKDVVEREEQIRDTVRRTDVEVDRDPKSAATPGPARRK